MKIIKKIDQTAEETRVEIISNDEIEIDRISQFLKNMIHEIVGIKNNVFYILNFEDIFYFESVDKRVYAYLKSDVFEIRKKLYEVEEMMPASFLRISKSTIIHLRKIVKFNNTISGNIIAEMKNGESLMVSRFYVKTLKEKILGGKL